MRPGRARREAPPEPAPVSEVAPPPAPRQDEEEDEDSQIRFLGWSDQPEILRDRPRTAAPRESIHPAGSGRTPPRRFPASRQRATSRRGLITPVGPVPAVRRAPEATRVAAPASAAAGPVTRVPDREAATRAAATADLVAAKPEATTGVAAAIGVPGAQGEVADRVAMDADPAARRGGRGPDQGPRQGWRRTGAEQRPAGSATPASQSSPTGLTDSVAKGSTESPRSAALRFPDHRHEPDRQHRDGGRRRFPSSRSGSTPGRFRPPERSSCRPDGAARSEPVARDRARRHHDGVEGRGFRPAAVPVTHRTCTLS
jgi:hypothetical protein